MAPYSVTVTARIVFSLPLVLGRCLLAHTGDVRLARFDRRSCSGPICGSPYRSGAKRHPFRAPVDKRRPLRTSPAVEGSGRYQPEASQVSVSLLSESNTGRKPSSTNSIQIP